MKRFRLFGGRADREERIATLFREGLARRERGEMASAVADFTAVLALDQCHSPSLLHRGMSLWNLGRREESVRDLEAFMRIEPSDTLDYMNAGAVVYIHHKEYGRAVELLDGAIRLCPKSYHAFLMRGIAWTGLSEHAKAISDFTHAMRFDPDGVEARYERAISRVNLGDMDGAKRDLEFCFTFFPDQIRPVAPLILNNMAWALATSAQDALRDGEKAVAWATRACELSDWKQPMYMDTLAAAYAEVGEYERAVATVERAMELPEFERACVESAHIMLEMFRAGKPYRRTDTR